MAVSGTRVFSNNGAAGGPPLQLFSTICFSVGISRQGSTKSLHGSASSFQRIAGSLIGFHKLLHGSANSCLSLCRFLLGFQKSLMGDAKPEIGSRNTEMGSRRFTIPSSYLPVPRYQPAEVWTYGRIPASVFAPDRNQSPQCTEVPGVSVAVELHRRALV